MSVDLGYATLSYDDPDLTFQAFKELLDDILDELVELGLISNRDKSKFKKA